MRSIMSAASVAFALCVASPAAGAVVVDTGAGPATGGLWVYAQQYLAAEFTLNQDSTVTSVEGWIQALRSGNIEVAIYSDSGDVPGTALDSATFSIVSGGDAQWSGAYNLNWNLAQGTYWLVFIGLDTVLAGMPGPSVSPMANEAYLSQAYGSWVGNDDLNIGIRINANAGLGNPGSTPIGGAAVPEPAGWAMMLLGFAGIGFAVQRQKRLTLGDSAPSGMCVGEC